MPRRPQGKKNEIEHPADPLRRIARLLGRRVGRDLSDQAEPIDDQNQSASGAPHDEKHR